MYFRTYRHPGEHLGSGSSLDAAGGSKADDNGSEGGGLLMAVPIVAGVVLVGVAVIFGVTLCKKRKYTGMTMITQIYIRKVWGILLQDHFMPKILTYSLKNVLTL